MAIMHLSFAKRVRNGAVATGLGAMALAGFCGPVLAQEEADEPFEQKVMRAILGNARGDIDYRERSPLVIPPARDLPPPEAGASAAAANPAWPKDADAAKNTRSGGRMMDPEQSARPLSPAEIKRGTVARSRDKPVVSPSDNESARALRPEEYEQRGKGKSLFSLFGAKPAAEAFVEEPTRTRMTQPPSGYQTPSATQPYAPPKTEGWFKLPSVFDRGLATDK